MMRLAPISVKKAIRLLKYFGFEEKRQKGSHLIFGNPQGKLIVVPIHDEEIGVGLLRAIIKELGVSREAYFEAMEKA
jgi:predicted RNA binding protein YcfA (HicA-like mRNA interferase family)